MLFDYRLAQVPRSERPGGTWGTWKAWGALVVVFGMLVFFVARGIVERHPAWFVFAGFFLLLTLAFGPYARWVKGMCRLAMTDDGMIVVASVIKFIPRRAVIDATRVTAIVRADVRKEQAILFMAGDRCLGKFNDRVVPKGRLRDFYRILKARYAHIDVPDGGPGSPKFPLFGVE